MAWKDLGGYMNQSESIAKLAAALSKAQSSMERAKKDSQNPFFKSKYADLESVWEACRESLAENELAVIQAPQMQGEGVCLETTLTHSSGEWIRSVMPLFLGKRDAQALGSAITYARRYALAAMVGIVQSDDDGEAAMKESRNPKKEEIQDMTLEQIKLSILKKIDIPNQEMLDEYLQFVKSKVRKPMKSVWIEWEKNPVPFLDHYIGWVERNSEKVVV